MLWIESMLCHLRHRPNFEGESSNSGRHHDISSAVCLHGRLSTRAKIAGRKSGRTAAFALTTSEGFSVTNPPRLRSSSGRLLLNSVTLPSETALSHLIARLLSQGLSIPGLPPLKALACATLQDNGAPLQGVGLYELLVAQIRRDPVKLALLHRRSEQRISDQKWPEEQARCTGKRQQVAR